MVSLRVRVVSGIAGTIIYAALFAIVILVWKFSQKMVSTLVFGPVITSQSGN